MRVRLETDACYIILQAIKERRYSLIASPVHLAEIEAIGESMEREQIELLLRDWSRPARVDVSKARTRAEALVTRGFGFADAAQLAYSEQAADVFLTCDDRLLKRCRRETMHVSVLNPVEFCAKEEMS